MKITEEKIAEIANTAMSSAGYGKDDFAGYYTIYENEEDSYDIAINKVKNDIKEYFTIYILPTTEQGWFISTNTLDKHELNNKLVELTNLIEQKYA